jgi:hypothetical protein
VFMPRIVTTRMSSRSLVGDKQTRGAPLRAEPRTTLPDWDG